MTKAELDREFRIKNPDYFKNYYQKNKARLSRRHKLRYEEKKQEILSKQREYYKTVRAKRMQYQLEYRLKNIENFRKWMRESRRKRRAQIKNSSYVPFTTNQLDQRLSMYGFRCWMCTKPYEEVDHVIPLARGGAHVLSNLRPICKSCNCRKGGR